MSAINWAGIALVAVAAFGLGVLATLSFAVRRYEAGRRTGYRQGHANAVAERDQALRATAGQRGDNRTVVLPVTHDRKTVRR